MSELRLQDHDGRLTAEAGGHELVIRYRWARPGVMRVDFVGVPSALGGQGWGTRLVGALVDKSRREGFSIVPVCGFAREQFRRHPEWQDVIA